MSKTSKPSKKEKKQIKEDWPLVVYMWIVGLAILGYVTARIALDGYPHPIHWISGIAGGLLGYPAGWLWFRWKGDVI